MKQATINDLLPEEEQLSESLFVSSLHHPREEETEALGGELPLKEFEVIATFTAVSCVEARTLEEAKQLAKGLTRYDFDDFELEYIDSISED